jgi:uncharacterized protein (DUF1778 family)
MPTRKRVKPATKDDRLAIRLSIDQKKELERKARRRGLSISSWLLSLGLSAPEEPVGASS